MFKHTILFAAVAGLVLALAGTAGAAIIIDSSYTGTLSGQGGGYTITVPVSFDASGSDKLVVMTGNRGSGGSIYGKSLTGITYGTTPMVAAVNARNYAVSPNPDGEAVVGIYYLDNPGAATTLTISYSAKMDTSGGYTLLALSGTADGVGATNATVTGVYPDTYTSASTSLTTTGANSLVLAVAAANRHNPNPVSPLDSSIDGGGSTYGAGYQFVATPSAVTPTFSMAAAYMPLVAAAEFTVLPEPATLALLGLGGLGLILSRKRK